MSSSKSTNNLLAISATLILLGMGSNIRAQETVQDQYQQFYDQSSTWEDYKMIKTRRLGQFWRVVTDTLNQQHQRIADAQVEINLRNEQIDTLRASVQRTETSLKESNTLNDSMAFFGVQMTRTLYNLVVWAIIIGLATGIVFIYLMYMRNNSITVETRNAFKSLESQYDAHREMARETQAKLKRELQTAINTLNEHRVR